MKFNLIKLAVLETRESLPSLKFTIGRVYNRPEQEHILLSL